MQEFVDSGMPEVTIAGLLSYARNASRLSDPHANRHYIDRAAKRANEMIGELTRRSTPPEYDDEADAEPNPGPI